MKMMEVGIVSVADLAGDGHIHSLQKSGFGGLQGDEVGFFCEGLQGITTTSHSMVNGTPLGPYSPITRLWQDQ